MNVLLPLRKLSFSFLCSMCFLLFLFLMLSCSTVPNQNSSVPASGSLTTRERLSEDHPEYLPSIPELDEDATLGDYLAYAALNNPGLEAAFQEWKAALEKIPQARALPDPRLSYAYFIEKIETRVGPQRQKIGISQMFPWFGKLKLRESIAVKTADAALQRYETMKRRLFFSVKAVYYEYYYIGRATSITRENIQLLTNFESVARSNYTAGKAMFTDVIKAQVELGKLEDRLHALEDLRIPVMGKLNAALNRPLDTVLPFPETIPELRLEYPDEQLFTWLRELNPELKSLDAVSEKEKNSWKLAKKNYYPDFMVGVDVIDTEEALMPGTPDSGKDPVIAMVSLNLPIWHGKYAAQKKEAQFRYKAAVNKRTDRENTLSADLKMILYAFRDAERKINLYRDTLIPKATQSLKVTQQAFETGKADFLNLIDSQRLLLEFELSYERAHTNQGQKLAEIEMLIGKDLPELPQKE